MILIHIYIIVGINMISIIINFLKKDKIAGKLEQGRVNEIFNIMDVDKVSFE